MTNTAQANTDREIRVFISSTFRDMHAERDYLVSHVFPMIRRACRERQVEFTEIDLRWGVTKEEAEQGKVVRICLEEINRCRPYFLSLLGERYGWAPLDVDLDHKVELLALFPFLESSLKEGLSVTEMEILHGVMDNPDMAGHCFFYLRDNALSQSLADSLSAATDYFETEQRLQDKLAALKEKVRSSGLPLRDNYASIEALGDLIKQDLLAVLDQQFPADLTPTPLEAEQNAHRSYADDRCKAYIANPRDTEALDAHLNTKTNNALLVTGESGLGKSALLAYWVNQQRLVNPDRFIIEHYVGISGDADPVAIIRRIMAEIKQRTDDSAELPSKPEDIIQDFPLWLAKVGERDPLLLIIDGLNQLENKEGQWLPDFWQENVKAIFSVIPGEQLETLSQREWPIHTLEALDLNRREQLIRDWLASYRKALSTEQTLRIAQAPQTGNPLFLKTVLEELRIFGYFEHLDQRIATLLTANNPKELFVLVLERLENDFGKAIVIQIMQAVWAARRGLSETEIAGITGLSRLIISTFLMAIDAHLAKRGGLLSFFHDYLRQAVKQHCLVNKETEINAHTKLAHYFQQQELNDRVAEELPWQWQQAKQYEALKECVSDISNFIFFYCRNEYELLNYWWSMEDFKFDYVSAYMGQLKKWEKDNEPGALILAETLLDLSDFFLLCFKVLTGKMGNGVLQKSIHLLVRSINVFLGHLNQDDPRLITIYLHVANAYLTSGIFDASIAEAYAKDALEFSERIFGEFHDQTANALFTLGVALKAQDEFEPAENYFNKVLSIREKIYGENNLYISSTYYQLASLLMIKGQPSKAESLYRKVLAIDQNTSYQGLSKAHHMIGLAKCLHEIGNHNVEVESLFKQALKIIEKFYPIKSSAYEIHAYDLTEIYKDNGNQSALDDLYEKLERHVARTENDFLLEIELTIALNKEIELDTQPSSKDLNLLFQEEIYSLEKILGANHEETILQLNYYFWYLRNLNLDNDAYIQLNEIKNRLIKSNFDYKLGAIHCLLVSGINLIRSGENLFALKYLKKALEIAEKICPPNSNKIYQCLPPLVECLFNLKFFEDAEHLYNRAFKISEHIIGEIDIDTLKGMQHLCVFLCEQGKFKEAEQLLREVIANWKRTASEDDTNLAGSLNALGLLLAKTGRIDEAKTLYHRALEIREMSLGFDHPQTDLIRERLAEIDNN